MMKTKLMQFAIIALFLTTISCKEKVKSELISSSFFEQGKLDSLIDGSKDLGSKEINDAMIRVLQYQKKNNCGNTNGIVIPKSYLNQAVNGFTQSGIIIPADTSNFSKWDFLVVYPGLSINEQGEEKNEPGVFFYKGTKNNSGILEPSGKPITDIKFGGGGGGPGDLIRPTPPPSTP